MDLFLLFIQYPPFLGRVFYFIAFLKNIFSFLENLFGGAVIQLYICTIIHKYMAKLKEKRVMVAVSESTKNKVAKKLAGTGFTIGWFFDESAKEMLKPYDGGNSILVKQIKNNNEKK